MSETRDFRIDSRNNFQSIHTYEHIKFAVVQGSKLAAGRTFATKRESLASRHQQGQIGLRLSNSLVLTQLPDRAALI